MTVRLLECGHAAVSGASRLCAHLLVEEPPGYHRVLTGSGVRYDLACAECVDQPLLTACEGCAERAAQWADDLGWKSAPEVRHEDRELAGSVRSEIWEIRGAHRAGGRRGGVVPGRRRTASLRLTQRWYAWDQPVAWLSEDLVAIQRIGDDDEAMLDGVELYEVPSGRRREPFAGPAGRMWGHEGLLYVSGPWGSRSGTPNAGCESAWCRGSGRSCTATGRSSRSTLVCSIASVLTKGNPHRGGPGSPSSARTSSKRR